MPDWAWDIVRVGAVGVAALIALRLGHHLVRRLVARLTHEDSGLSEDARSRALTLGGVARGFVTSVVVFVVALVVMSAAGIPIAPFLATAGLIGIAIGFGARALVQDWIAGFFIVFERQFDLGDWIEVAGVAGAVEEINLRSTVLRDLDGSRHVVSNGQIQISSNRTSVYSRYVFVLGISYDADIDRALSLIAEVGEGLRRDPRFSGSVDGPVTVLGVDDFGESSIDIKAYVQTTPGEHWRVGRELRRRLKMALDEAGIEIPFPHRELIIRSREELSNAG